MIQANFWEVLKTGLPQVSWVAVQDHFDKLRFIKTPEEVDRIRHLSKLTDKSLGEALSEIRPGQTEMDLAGALGGAIYRNGAENFPIMVVAPSGRASEPVPEYLDELEQRGARIIVLSDRNDLLDRAHTRLPLPPGVPEWISPIVAIAPGQLWARSLSEAKGLDPDTPRGLSKVTLTR